MQHTRQRHAVIKQQADRWPEFAEVHYDSTTSDHGVLSALCHFNNSDVTGLDGNQQVQNTTVDATEKEPGLSESRLSGQAEAQSCPDQCVTHEKSTATRTAEASGPQTGNAIGYEMEHHVIVELHLSQNDLDGLDDGRTRTAKAASGH